MNQYKTKAQQRINETVKQLENDVNNSIIDFHDVETAFMRIHPYLLNLLAKGICSAVNNRKTDGRININGLTYILNE